MMDQTIAYLEQTKADYVKEIAGLTEAQWRFKTSPECWSVAECAEHLAIVEDFLFGQLQAMKDAPPVPPEELEKIKGREQVILRAVPVRNGRKAQAPERARPANRWPDPASMIAHFVEIRDRTIAFARTAGEELRTHTYPHFVFGPLDGYQWLVFLAAHTQRHLLQAGEVKAHPDFPK